MAKKQKVAPPVQDDIIEVDSIVEFTGFTGDEEEGMPDNGEHLVEGETYAVDSIVEGASGDDEEAYSVRVPNPKYNSKKKASKANQEFLLVEVFNDEVALMVPEDEDEEEEEAPKPKAKSKAKAPAKKQPAKKSKKQIEEEEAEEDEEEEEPAPKSKSKAKAKAKAPAKKTTAKSKAKAPAKSKDEDSAEVDSEGYYILAEDQEDQEVLTLVQDADDICDLAVEVVREAEACNFKLGGVLYHLRKEKSYVALSDEYAGNKGFELYCEQVLNLKYRRAMYFVKIYSTFSKLGIDGSRVAELGWTKCIEILDVLDEENADEWLEIAANSTVNDLKDTVKESTATKTKGKSEVVKRTTFKFRLVETAGEVIAEYLEKAGETLGLDDPSEVFEHVLTEWAQEHLPLENTKKTKGKAKK